MIDIFIPSYHRPYNLRTCYYFKSRGYDMSKITVFIDSEADDQEDYKAACNDLGCNLHVFDIDEARERYDFIHRKNVSRRCAGMARNMFHEYAIENGIDFFMISDDDSSHYEIRSYGLKSYKRIATLNDILYMMRETEKLMRERRIGFFGWLQTGDFYSAYNPYIFRKKVMNTTFCLMPYVNRLEKGILDSDTSAFVGIMNRGLFTGSYGCGCVLMQMLSATQEGGLTEIYNECKLLNKSLTCVIQYPSAINANIQEMNGGRIHHKINYRYLMPKILKGDGSVDNIPWDTYPEDFPFTNEPKRKRPENEP